MRVLRCVSRFGLVVAVLAAGCDKETKEPPDARVDADIREPDGSEPDSGEPDSGEPDSGEPDGGELDGGDAAIEPDAKASACEWEERCSADGTDCVGAWICRYSRCFDDPDACSCPKVVECGASEFCSERSVCGARCAKAEGCAGEPCLGDESCAAHEYCSNAEICATRCADPEGCEGEPCMGDESCGEDEYCSNAKRCAPRCSEELGCAGPEFKRGHRDRAVFTPVWPLVSDGAKVYFHRPHGSYSDDVTRGAEEPEDELFSWDLEGTPQQLGQEWIDIGQLAVRDGFLYVLGRHHTFGSYFRRFPLDGTPRSTVASSETGIRAFWFTEDAVWWSSFGGAGAELWRLSRLGTSERVATADHDGWVAGDEAGVFRQPYISGSEPTEIDLVRDALPDLTVSETIGTYTRERPFPTRPGADTMLVDGDSLFITLGARGTELVRIPLDDPGAKVPLAAPEVETRNVVVEGSWVYWGARLDDVTASIQRRHRDGASPPEELVRGNLAPNLFTVTADALVYSNGERFVVKPLAPP